MKIGKARRDENGEDVGGFPTKLKDIVAYRTYFQEGWNGMRVTVV